MTRNGRDESFALEDLPFVLSLAEFGLVDVVDVVVVAGFWFVAVSASVNNIDGNIGGEYDNGDGGEDCNGDDDDNDV